MQIKFIHYLYHTKNIQSTVKNHITLKVENSQNFPFVLPRSRVLWIQSICHSKTYTENMLETFKICYFIIYLTSPMKSWALLPINQYVPDDK